MIHPHDIDRVDHPRYAEPDDQTITVVCSSDNAGGEAVDVVTSKTRGLLNGPGSCRNAPTEVQ
jgi:hypothetical protein